MAKKNPSGPSTRKISATITPEKLPKLIKRAEHANKRNKQAQKVERRIRARNAKGKAK